MIDIKTNASPALTDLINQCRDCCDYLVRNSLASTEGLSLWHGWWGDMLSKLSSRDAGRGRGGLSSWLSRAREKLTVMREDGDIRQVALDAWVTAVSEWMKK